MGLGRKGEKHSIAQTLYASFVCMCVCMLSHLSRVQLFVTPWTVAFQAPLSMGFSRQEYWSGYSFLQGIKLGSPALQADSLPTEPPGKP